MADFINDNPKTTRIDKPVESLIQYQGRDTVLDITIDEQTPLMEVYRDQKNHVTLKALNDNTKENKIEIIGENSDLLEITHGENGTDETTKLEPISDIRKENIIEPVPSLAGNILSSIEHGTNRTNETSKLKIENDNTKEQVLEAKESITGNNLIGLEKAKNGTNDTTKIFGINDNTKEQLLEVSGTEQEKKLITLEKGTNGTKETTKITVHSDDSKENKLTFQTGTPDTVGISRVGNTININVNNSGGEPTHLNFSTDTPDLLDVSRENENIKINAFHDSTKQNIFTASTETSNLIEVKQESDKLIINGKSDSTKENILNFNTQTPNNISVSKKNNEVTINFLGGSTSEKIFESTDKNLLTIIESENKVLFTPKHDTTKEDKLTFTTLDESMLSIERSGNEIMFIPEHDTTKQDVLTFKTNTPDTTVISKSNNTVSIDVNIPEHKNVIFSIIENDKETNSIKIFANTKDVSKYFVLHSHSEQSGGNLIQPTDITGGKVYIITNPYNNKKNKITISYGDSAPNSNPYQYFDFTYMDYLNITPFILKNISYHPKNDLFLINAQGDFSNIKATIGQENITGYFSDSTGLTSWQVSDNLNESFIIFTDSNNKALESINIDPYRLDYKYPVGSLFFSPSNQTDPNLTIGGKWNLVSKGRTLVGVDPNDPDFNVPEKEGGEKTHTLSVNEIPPHKHKQINYWSGSAGSNTTVTQGLETSDPRQYPITDFYTDNTGGGQAHNNLQPYYTVYIWRRIS